MDTKNQTMITDIFLLGFPNLQNLKIPFILLLILCYCLTVIGNFFIIVLVSASKTLHCPMYFFLRQLSISDILLATDIVPNMLHIEMNEGATMHLASCITQFYFFGSLELTESFLLTIMSYDRYLAICSPLLYPSIMVERFCIKLAAICWLLGFTIIMGSSVTINTLQFCGDNTVDHFFCDLFPLLELSCSDTFPVIFENMLVAGPVLVSPFLFVIASYISIAVAIQQIKSNAGRQKAFATCSSHLTVVSIFYGALIGIYVVPATGKLITMSKLLSLMYTVVTPLLNPVIYSMRNKDIKGALINKLNQYGFYAIKG